MQFTPDNIQRELLRLLDSIREYERGSKKWQQPHYPVAPPDTYTYQAALLEIIRLRRLCMRKGVDPDEMVANSYAEKPTTATP